MCAMESEYKIQALTYSLLCEQKKAILCTQSLDFLGYPYGSAVPYCMSHRGRPLILISRIAEHTQNIAKNQKVSLMVVAESNAGVQQTKRVTYVANAKLLTHAEIGVGERYFQFFPKNREYFDELDFEFYELEPVGIRYIGGFADAHWLKSLDFPHPFFPPSDETTFLSKWNQNDQEKRKLIALDPFGADFLEGQSIQRYRFKQAMSSLNAAAIELSAR